MQFALFTEIFFKVYKPLYFYFFQILKPSLFHWSQLLPRPQHQSCCHVREQTLQNLPSNADRGRPEWDKCDALARRRSEPWRRGVVQPSLFWERAGADAHCWVCKQVTSTHCEGWINTPPPSPLFYPLPPPNQPLTPARPFHLSPLCGDYRTVWKEEEPSILFPSQSSPLAFTRTPPSACTYANAVITLHFTAVVFPSLFLAGWSFSSPSFKITFMHTCICSMKAL